MDNKIVINSSILDECPTGLGIYVKNVVKELYKQDKNIRVLSPVDIAGIKVEKINKYVKPSYKKTGGLMRFLWTQLILPFKVKKDEVIYHPFQYLTLLSRAKQIITIHDFIPLHYPDVAKHQNKYYKILMPLLLKRAYKIVAISENTKKDILKFYNIDENKICVIPNGYDNNFFNVENININVLKKYNINYNYMIMVGASYPHKNLELAIRAIANIKKECKIIIVGKDSDYIKKLKKLAKELNIEEKINFIGYIPDEDLPALYYYSKAFLYTTLYEGFGLPILEAMGCGTVVITSDNSSLAEVYGDAALIFKNNDLVDLQEKIEEILNNENLRQELIEKSKKNIKRFSWEKTAKEIYKILK
ncbi:glycosyltransferase family 4 protein [Clostridium gasigenes]|uniref:Glycosyltransferase family 4 protein n=1 Tax=Clostridium gasigenes TaxID=94869 RepID=A0A7X0S9F6_9CLOT|nr:glycosyltransferase family 1 protein [Clostridium gasigenes]MBB6713503.1 glycosyltransferase family 4 protein [Clostridium gasigenes]